MMLGAKLCQVARLAGMAPWEIARVLEAHGHVRRGRCNRLRDFMLPWLERHIPDELPHPTSPLVDAYWRAYHAWTRQLPAELRGPHLSTAYDAQYGDARRLLYNRARY